MMKRLIILALCSYSCFSFRGFGMTVGKIECEHRMGPLGVDVLQPKLSWILASLARGDRQIAYQILVATSENILQKDSGDMWDSGKIESDETLQIAYAGKPLESSQRVF